MDSNHETHPVTIPGPCKHHDTRKLMPRAKWDDGPYIRECIECGAWIDTHTCDHDEYNEDAECMRCGVRCRHTGTFSWVSGSVFGATLACDDCGLQAAC